MFKYPINLINSSKAEYFRRVWIEVDKFFQKRSKIFTKDSFHNQTALKDLGYYSAYYDKLDYKSLPSLTAFNLKL